MTLTLWPNHILTQFLTNRGCFRSYLYKMKRAPTPLCNCPEKAQQTARHLMTDCTLFSKERPAVFRKLPLPQIMQYHINTVKVSRLIHNIYHMLQDIRKVTRLCNYPKTTSKYTTSNKTQQKKKYCKYPAIYRTVKYGLHTN
jgi:hypothetical protein